ncbi:MAG: carboxypeptidase-like regulatory domain-containing protein, partial [bacterium]
VVRWETPADASGVVGYHWLLDQSHDSVPGSTARFIERPELELEDLKDGGWSLHVATKDCAGNLSREAGHYRLNIDTTPPPAPTPRCLTHPGVAWFGTGDASFEWTVPSDPAKIAGYHWCVDSEPATLPGPGKGTYATEASASVSGLADGTWWFHVAAVDRAGNVGIQAGHCRLHVARTPPPPEVSSPTHPRPGESGSGRDAVFHWSAPLWSRSVVAWRYCLDKEPLGLPDAGCSRTTELRAEFSGLGPGDWFFHISSESEDGVLGTLATHFPVKLRDLGGLAGQVTKPNGILPLAGAQLEVFRSGKSVAKTASGEDGRFRFEGLEAGEVLVKLDVAGLPALLVDGIRLDGAEAQLNLSPECMAWTSPRAGVLQVRFAVLTKEIGRTAVKVYGPKGQTLAEIEAPAARPGYVKLAWDCSQTTEDNLLWQAQVTGADGRAVKYPIRKLKISR